MKYEELSKRIIRRYLVHDGYSGKTVEVGLAYYDGGAFEVAKHGYYAANGREYANEEEMVFAFDNFRATHFPQVVK